jgi:hypothetical protein
VTGTGPQRWAADGDGSVRDFAPLRDQGRRAGIVIEIDPAADGTRLAWSVPLRP